MIPIITDRRTAEQVLQDDGCTKRQKNPQEMKAPQGGKLHSYDQGGGLLFRVPSLVKKDMDSCVCEVSSLVLTSVTGCGCGSKVEIFCDLRSCVLLSSFFGSVVGLNACGSVIGDSLRGGRSNFFSSGFCCGKTGFSCASTLSFRGGGREGN